MSDLIPPPSDAADRLLIDVAFGGHDPLLGDLPPGPVAVVDDATGAIARAALAAGRPVRTWNTSRGEASEVALALAGEADGVAVDSLAEAADGAGVVLARLPVPLAALERLAAVTAAHAAPDAMLLGAGRLKYMRPAQNDLLASCYSTVRATLGRQKSRVLIARTPRRDVPAPRVAAHAENMAGLRVELRGIGAVFNGARVDGGSRLLLESLLGAAGGPDLPIPETVADLGCGNGVLTARLALSWPETRFEAGDDSRDAVGSTLATLAANGLVSGSLVAGDLAGGGLVGGHPHADESAAGRSDAGESAAGEPSAGESDAGESETNGVEAGAPHADGPDAVVAPAGRVRVRWDRSFSELADGWARLIVLNPPFHERGAIDPSQIKELLTAGRRVLAPGGQLWMVHNSHLRYRPLVEAAIGPVDQRARDARFTVLRAVRA